MLKCKNNATATTAFSASLIPFNNMTNVKHFDFDQFNFLRSSRLLLKCRLNAIKNDVCVLFFFYWISFAE